MRRYLNLDQPNRKVNYILICTIIAVSSVFVACSSGSSKSTTTGTAAKSESQDNKAVVTVVSSDSLIAEMAKVSKAVKDAQIAKTLNVEVYNDVKNVVDKVNKAITNNDVRFDQDLAKAMMSLDIVLTNSSIQAKADSTLYAALQGALKPLNDLQKSLGIISTSTDVTLMTSFESSENNDGTDPIYNLYQSGFGKALQKRIEASEVPPTKSSNVNVSQKGIKTRYGTHDYGCKTQAEYDKAMAILDKVVGNYDYINKDSLAWKMHEAYIKGVRYTEYQKGTDEYNALYLIQKRQGLFFKLTNPKNYDIAFTVDSWSSILREGVTNSEDNTPCSLYDVLVRKVTDCYADAQLQSAIYDKLGFNTKVMSYKNQAWSIAKTSGIWWNIQGSSFYPANPDGGEQISGETFK